jgi:hypothetical protein
MSSASFFFAGTDILKSLLGNFGGATYDGKGLHFPTLSLHWCSTQ